MIEVHACIIISYCGFSVAINMENREEDMSSEDSDGLPSLSKLLHQPAKKGVSQNDRPRGGGPSVAAHVLSQVGESSSSGTHQHGQLLPGGSGWSQQPGSGVPEQPGGSGWSQQQGGSGGSQQSGGSGWSQQPGGSGRSQQPGGLGWSQQPRGSGRSKQPGGTGGPHQAGGMGAARRRVRRKKLPYDRNTFNVVSRA